MSRSGTPTPRGSRRGDGAAARADYREHQRRLARLSADLAAVYAGFDAREAALMSGAKRWLSDNDYLIRRSMRQAASDLPWRHHSRLPVSAAGGKRVTEIVERFLEVNAGVYRGAELERFLEEEQRQRPLEQAEVWALPTLLRLGILGRLVAGATAAGVGDREAAGRRLASDGEATVEAAVLSLHAVEREDWQALALRVSAIERTLARDPSGVYQRMDRRSRAWYHREVETLARGCQAAEHEVAAAAVARAEAAAVALGPGAPEAHVGFSLVDAGREALEAELGAAMTFGQRLRRALRHRARRTYPAAVAALSLLALLPLAAWVARAGSLALTSLAAAALAVPAWLLAERLVQRAVVALLPPRRLPKLDLSAGVPDELRTLVVMPVLFTDGAEVERLSRQLERHYVGNADPNVDFALLGDLLDADAEHDRGDDEVLQAAERALVDLRRRQPEGRFYLLCRRRLFNPAEGVWMGWERKRGKLEELGRWLLRGEAGTLFALGGELDELREYAHVITLDADTRLPPTAAARLIGALGHPLNAPRLDDDGRLERGYTVLQPRVEVLPAGADGTRFERWFAGGDGLDLYTRAVSDPYMDLFGEGLYAGKGAYHLRGFARTLDGLIGENTVLSHDVLEGGAGRCALVSDVVVYEEHPRSVLAYLGRQHRWMRGDWQLLPYLASRLPTAGARIRNPVSWVARWAMAQSLVRSLHGPALLAALVLGWAWLPVGAGRWTLAVLALSAAPWLLTGLGHLARASLAGATRRGRNEVSRWLVEIGTLPLSAANGIDAVVTSLYRMRVTRRRLLEWRDARSVDSAAAANGRRAEWWRALWISPAVAVATTGLLLLLRPAALPVTLPLLLAWLAAPELARAISRPLPRSAPSLGPAEAAAWLKVMRRTWLYFERFVGPEDNWLPPDHFQESPRGAVAHRTSPTNIGLTLTATFAAYDLGFLEARSALTRVSHTFASMAKLERHRGHLLNWYDTQTLQPLAPRYVSTVDSGNLLACLIAVRECCLELPRQRVLRRESLAGLLPLFELLSEVARDIGAEQHEFRARVEDVRLAVASRLADEAFPTSLIDDLATVHLPELDAALLELVRAAGPGAPHEAIGELGVWSGRLHAQVAALQRERDLYLPWLAPGARWPAEVLEGLTPTAELPAWGELEEWYRTLTDRWASREGDAAHRDAALEDLSAAVAALRDALATAGDLAKQAEAELRGVDLGFLYDARRRVFRIGYRVDDGEVDQHAYDLYASEARLASFVAIALGQVPPAHWLHLSRPLAAVAGERTLLSWSGTLFEYLMPSLFLRTPQGSLAHEAIVSAIGRQRAYGAAAGLPWGVSESAYALQDAQLNYQYRAFGVPDLALSHDSEGEAVVAPYAGLMAARYEPSAAQANLEELRRLGAEGLYGFYDAVDFSPDRAASGTDHTVVRTFMVHHHGMAFMALANLLLADRYVTRFHRDVRVQAVDHLLDEGPAAGAPLDLLDPKLPLAPAGTAIEGSAAARAWSPPATGAGRAVNSLSNGALTSVLSSAGRGFLSWRGVDLTRWRADPTLDEWGLRLYLRDAASGTLREITGPPAAGEEVSFEAHQVVYRRDWGDLGAALTVAVASDVDAELRVLNVTNHSDRPRELALCTFGEVVLAPHAADLRHPAFGSLFVQSEVLAGQAPGRCALLLARRPREAGEERLQLVHALVPESPEGVSFTQTTDRARFIGRYGSLEAPAGLEGDGALAASNETDARGAPLDPVFAVKADFLLEPYATRRFAVLTAAAGNRRDALAALERYAHFDRFAPAIEAARQRAERELRRTGLGVELETAQAVLSALLYATERWRPSAELLASSQGPQARLWVHGISGDLPLLVVRLAGPQDVDAALLLLKAHRYWRAQGLEVEVALVNLSDSGYQQDTQVALRRVLASTGAEAWLDRRGGIFVIGGARLSAEQLSALLSAATVLVDGESLAAGGRDAAADLPPGFFPALEGEVPPTPPVTRPDGLLFDNGFGGFAPDSGDYVIWLDGEPPPRPWINVLANPEFGCLVTESGASTTWAVNSGENRLTPWSNDPVRDPSGEALYLRDEETSEVWTPTPLPAHGGAPYVVRHAPGSTLFEHASHSLLQELEFVVADDAPVKLARLRLRDLSGRPRRLTATYFLEWVLGNAPESTRQRVVPEFAHEHQALLARNPFATAFGEQVAFLASDRPVHAFTTDRREFLGAEGGRARPAGLARIGLSGRVDARCDPCAALQVHVDLTAHGEQELWFVIGRGADRDDAEVLLREWRSAERAQRAARESRAAWDERLGQLRVRTPDRALDLLVDRWLLYQAWACRLWGRTAFYQSSGAYGFRDQLQDALALLDAAPGLVRDQLLRAAERQFEEGDVLHWWHPPGGEGVRTRITDDLAWLPYVTARYIEATGDESVLAERLAYLRGAPLAPGEHERYDAFAHGEQSGSLHEHCLRALERACTRGSHGLPLIGGGDWNDGLNRVGEEGRGESVWLAWFLIATAEAYAEVCARLGDEAARARLLSSAQAYRQAVEEHAWDGEWYLRAFYDDGSPLGSHANDEARIDAIAQAWAVLSGAGDPDRAMRALQAVDEHLLDERGRVLALLAPPFDVGDQQPGYIKGYLPGVRENGGQYTHGAIWVAWAHAARGDGDRAHALFSLLNPINHAHDRCSAQRYGAEPYAVSADVYSREPHVGRGGWSWYTGSAAWLRRLAVEAILGVRRVAGRLRIEPCVPRGWPSFECDYRHGRTLYSIVVANPQGVSSGVVSVTLDGRPVEGDVELVDDGLTHAVHVTLGPRDG